MTPAWSLRRLPALDDTQIDALADVLIDCVEGGASVSFMHPLTRDRAVAFWRRVAQGVAAGERALLVAEDVKGLCGTVQLILDQPENQPHRAVDEIKSNLTAERGIEFLQLRCGKQRQILVHEDKKRERNDDVHRRQPTADRRGFLPSLRLFLSGNGLPGIG